MPAAVDLARALTSARTVPPRPWHDTAIGMLKNGATYADIADECGVSTVTVCRLFNRDYRVRQQALSEAYRLRRAA
jgi:methylphosphotriester-DNA--protein-cysteine methyltransferase